MKDAPGSKQKGRARTVEPPFAALALVACVAWPAAAGADGTTSALSWVRLAGAEGCMSAGELSQKVEARLRRSVFVSPSAADVSIEGHAEVRAGGGFHVVVKGTRRDGSPAGTRELDSDRPDCHAFDETVVLVVALMIDPDATVAPPPPPSPPPAPPVEREIVHERVIVHEVSPPAPAPPWLVDAHAAGTLAFGRVPGAAPGLALAVRVGPRLVPLEVLFGTIPSSDLQSGARSSSYWLLEGGLAVCPLVPVGERVEVGGCAGVRVGNVHTRGAGFETNAEVDRPLVDGIASGRALVTVVRPVFAMVSAAAVVPFVRQRTTGAAADGSTVVLYERPALGAELALGFGVRFSP